jgi:quercetin 2,3-dioxygenase
VVVVLRGSLRVDGSEPIEEAEVGLFDRSGVGIAIDEASEARALLLSGEPIHEPIVGMGPFVMNSPGEIRQAMIDFESGRMGRL